MATIKACLCRDAIRQREKMMGAIGPKVGTPGKARRLRGGAI